MNKNRILLVLVGMHDRVIIYTVYLSKDTVVYREENEYRP